MGRMLYFCCVLCSLLDKLNVPKTEQYAANRSLFSLLGLQVKGDGCREHIQGVKGENWWLSFSSPTWKPL